MLGPGLLYAGAAVGVSHLVQSTRAGASFGFELLWIIILANAIKYPFFQFGPRYASVTGHSLVSGYHKLGRWAVILYFLLTVATMFAIQAAVTIVTAGLLGNIFHISINPIIITAIILLGVIVILLVGKYKALDKLIKYIIVILALSTIMAVIFGFSNNYDPAKFAGTSWDWGVKANIFFLVAFIGWMPAPIDVSVWHSVWSVAKNDQLGYKPKLKQSLTDFNIGYIGTALLALGFLTLGALVMFRSGETASEKGVEFAGQLIRLYTTSLGNWSYWLIALAALATMFSTTLSVFDAYPRVLAPATNILMNSKDPEKDNARKLFWIWSFILIAGTIALLTVLSNTMRFMVDLATTVSFVTAPAFAILNYMVVTHKHMPKEGKPGLWLKIYSWIGIIFLSAFSIYYIIFRLMQ